MFDLIPRMDVKLGTILKSTDSLLGTVFDGVQVLIVEYNEKGAIGFVLNKPLGRSLNQLEEFRQMPPFELYNGGPVDQEHLFFIHQRPDLIQEGVAIRKDLFWGGAFQQVIEGIQNGQLTNKDVKIFVGYCGWDKGELEAELEEGSWKIANEKTAVF